ncbi:MAG: hypothetical protein GXY44_06185 [Phycisphaerales bacterium]|nr:hypothetical protein [Phycisphaerales bacterium]
MKLKTYQGHSMADALAKVKQDLGTQAVIMHTRTLRKGGVLGVGSRTVVEITASAGPAVLPASERRALGGLDHSPPRRGRIDRASSEPAIREPSMESDVLGVATGKWNATAPAAEAGFPALRHELDELRIMVRELLNRSAADSTGISPGPPDEPAELRDYYTCLIQNAVADEIARDILTRARERLAECRIGLRARRPVRKGRLPVVEPKEDAVAEEQALRRLVPAVFVETIERMLPEAEPVQMNTDGTPRYVALVGPTGVGKTTTIAKLAAHFKLRENKRVGLITIDTYRIAAVDQLKAYAQIMRLPLEVVLTPQEMVTAIRSLSDLDLVLIDTTGRSQNDGQRLDDLKGFLDAVRSTAAELRPTPSPEEQAADSGEPTVTVPDPLEVHLVLSCTAHPGLMVQVAERFAALGVDRVVFTKVDEAIGIGVIFNLITRLNMRMSYLTTGQDVPDDIEVSHRRRIAEMVLGRAAQRWPMRSSEAVNHIA